MAENRSKWLKMGQKKWLNGAKELAKWAKKLAKNGKTISNRPHASKIM